MSKDKVIAIDGPSGSGKSTIAKLVARRLGLTYLDTGAMFRALGYCLRSLDLDLSKGLSSEESELVANYLSDLNFEYGVDDKILIRINNEDLTEKIREHEISKLASMVSKFEEVRNYLKKIQRKIASEKKSVLEGRDIGTIIFPNAAVKIYLTADARVRAERRYEQLIEQDNNNKDKFTLEEILEDIETRDKHDKNRDIAPLVKAEDAIEIDTSFLTVDEVAERIISEYNNRRNIFDL